MQKLKDERDRALKDLESRYQIDFQFRNNSFQERNWGKEEQFKKGIRGSIEHIERSAESIEEGEEGKWQVNQTSSSGTMLRYLTITYDTISEWREDHRSAEGDYRNEEAKSRFIKEDERRLQTVRHYEGICHNYVIDHVLYIMTFHFRNCKAKRSRNSSENLRRILRWFTIWPPKHRSRRLSFNVRERRRKFLWKVVDRWVHMQVRPRAFTQSIIQLQ